MTTEPIALSEAEVSPPIRLITRADDFGASPGTNEAILDCLSAGFIRNVGVMAPSPFLSHRLDELIARQSEFCLGLHATLNSEWSSLRWGPVLPVEEVSSLVEADGTFHRSTHTLNQRGLAAEMIREVEAQLKRLQSLGLTPRYLDTHMVFSWIEGIAQELSELCRREGLIFADDPSFCRLPLQANENLGPDQIRSAIRNLGASHPGGQPLWIFHPARYDACSELFFCDASKPSTAISKERHCEYLTLSNASLIAGWKSSANILPSTYFLTD
jgi:predicted glycoside hydrolase/deacetylase ChbG (UPF0249 family)